jgi:signal peptidase I
MIDTTDVFIKERPNKKSKSTLREFTETIVLSVLTFLVIRTCVIQSCKIPSESMLNTLVIGDCLFVNKFIYGIKIPFTNYRLPKIRNPERGDVVVFRFPLDRSNDFIKRLVGVPGDTIQIRNKQVYVNNVLYQNSHELHTDPQILSESQAVRDNFGPIQVPVNSYFMMGDNRDNSYDSRFWGFVQSEDIVGLAFIKYWSWDNTTWLPRLNRIGTFID